MAKKDISRQLDRTKAASAVLLALATIDTFISFYRVEGTQFDALSKAEKKIELTKPLANKPLKDLFKRTLRWLHACLDDMKVDRKNVSAGMERDFTKIFDESQAIKVHYSDENMSAFSWAAWIHAVNTLLVDIKCAYPHITKEPRKKGTGNKMKTSWRYLLQAWELLTKSTLKCVMGERDAQNRNAEELGNFMAWDFADFFRPSASPPYTKESYADFLKSVAQIG